MTLESERYGKVLTLLARLKTSSVMINAALCECHSKLKEFSLVSEANREEKLEIELELREKSTALAICEKLVEILGWLEPSYSQKYKQYQFYLEDRNRLELTFALTSAYFIYLSDQSYQYRRETLSEWRANVSMMAEVP